MSISLRDSKGRFVKGNHPPNEWKIGHIPWDKGLKRSEFLKHFKNGYYPGCGNLNRHHSDKTKKKMSESKQGEKHPNWKGGVSKSKERHKMWNQTYHTRRRTWEENGGRFNFEILQKVYEDNIKEFSTLTCYLCLKKIRFGNDSIDHIIPLSRGGTNYRRNLAVAHRNCNSKKHNRTLIEYKRKIKSGF